MEPKKITFVVPMRPFHGRQDRVDEWALKSSHLPIKIIVSLYSFSDSSVSVDILKELSATNPDYLTVIQHEYNDPGSSRNFGLNLVNTEWVVFADSDDLVHPEIYLNWIKHKNENINIHIGRYKRVGRNQKNSPKFFPKSISFLNGIYMIKNPGLWRFLIKADLAKSYEFPPLTMGEDLVFLARLNLERKSILFHNNVCYEYMQHNMQLTRSSYRYEKLLNCFETIETDSREYFSWFSLLISIKVVVSVAIRSTAKKSVKIGALCRELVLLVKFITRKTNLQGKEK